MRTRVVALEPSLPATTVDGDPDPSPAQQGSPRRTRNEPLLETARRFLQSLTPDQRAATRLEFGDLERLRWHYLPDRGFREAYGHDRRGVTFKEMDPPQRLLAHALISAGLGRSGFIKALTVMSLEEVLRLIENDTTGNRDAEKYHLSMFGEPKATGIWGWRVEGHHLSLNFVVQEGNVVASSPAFFGANPHEVPEGPQKGMRALAKEEDLATTLLNALTPKQRERAVFLDIAPHDIVTTASVRARLEGEPQGLPASQMDDNQVDHLMRLIGEYANNMPPDIAAERMAAAREASRDNLFFGWAGATSRTTSASAVDGQETTGHRTASGTYYRVHGPTFLIEYDNTQNQGNHSHSVWRDFDGDFGLDLLAEHYRLDAVAASPAAGHTDAETGQTQRPA